MESTVLKTVLKETKSSCLLLINREGELLETCGDFPLNDSKTFCVLAANSIAAQKNMSELLNAPSTADCFFSLQGQNNIYFYLLNERISLLVLCSSASYPGFIRFKLEQLRDEILKYTSGIENQNLSRYGQELMFDEIKDEEIDSLFNF